MLAGFDLILNELSLNDRQLFLVLLPFHKFQSLFFFVLDCHLQLQLTPHVLSLGLEEGGLLSRLLLPIVYILLDLCAPLGRGHTDHFPVV